MSMVLNALPDFSSQLRSLQTELQQRSERIAELEEELRREKLKRSAIENGAASLRMTLAPLYNALQMVFGHIDTINPNGVQNNPVSDSKRAVWDSWKQKLGGLTAKAIDVLMLHGPMNSTQLRIQLHCANGSVTNIVTALNKAGLINRVDGKIALKEI
jgi:chromosome segregation ATPase